VVQIVARIGPGAGGRGWQYTPAAIAQLVEHVQQHSLNGYLGHLTDDELSHKFPTPVVAWVGARLAGETAYVRGIVDKSATDVKRWLKARRITQPSILTRPKLANRRGGTFVDAFDEIISLDLAPLGRAGMPSATIVYAGEQKGPDMDLSKIALALGLVAEASFDEVVGAATALRALGERALARDIEQAVAEMSVPVHLRAVVGELALPKLKPTSTAAEIASTVTGVKSSAAYRAAAGNTSAPTLNPAAPRTGTVAGPDMSVFQLTSPALGA
jgi:hypothetical protein